MKKLREMAEICGVTTQAVGSYLRKTGLHQECKMVGNRLMIPKNVQEQLIIHYQIRNTKDNYQQDSKIIETLTKQLEIKDEQIKTLSALLEHEQQLRMANKALEQPKRRFWQRNKQSDMS